MSAVPHARSRRSWIGPATIAAALTAVGLIGASFVYVQGGRILRADQATIDRATSPYLASLERIEEALDLLDGAEPGSERFGRAQARLASLASEARVDDLGGERILEPLRARAARLDQALRRLVAQADAGQGPRLQERLAEARAALGEARAEAIELRCHARIECQAVSAGS